MKKRVTLLLCTVLSMSIFNGCTSGSNASSGNKTNYPTKAVQITVGWGAGGGTDVFARAIAQPASEIMGKPVTVVNMAGASGALAGDSVAKGAADGYTIWAEGSNYSINVAMKKTPHELKEYIPIARIQHDTVSLQVNKDSKFKTFDELLEFAKANPGKVTVGGTGSAGFDQVVVAKLQKAAGVEFKYVPFEDAGAMRSSMLGGHIDAQMEELGPVAKLIEDGTIRPLLAFTDSKIARFPDIPISVDKGINVVDGIWRGLFVKAGTPKEIVDYLRETFKKAKDSESYKTIEKNNMLDLRPGYLDSEDFTKFVEKDISEYEAVLKELGYIK